MHGMCRQAAGPRTERSAGAVAVRERRADEGLSDADRQQAVDVLTAAFRDGVLRVDDFDQRVSAALSADVVGDLAGVTGDLPAQWRADLEAAEAAAQRAAKHRRRWSAEIRTYARVMALLWAIWLVIAITGDGTHYPWPIWPTLGWGVPLVLGRPTGPAARQVRRPQTAREY